jgi:hypothetical protein
MRHTAALLVAVLLWVAGTSAVAKPVTVHAIMHSHMDVGW